MKVNTFLFGEIEVDPANIISFPEGLAGLENSRRFILVHEPDHADTGSYTLQSIDEAAVALQVADTAAIGFHYELVLDDAEGALLQNPAPEDLAVMVVLFKPESAAASVAANIRAPLLINTRARVGVQKNIHKLRSNITLSNLASNV